MTCIAGVLHDGHVYIGGDSAGVAGLSLSVRADEKVFKIGDFVFGFTSSFRMGQLLRYSFTPPKRDPDIELSRYMCTSFVDAVRTCLKNGGFVRSVNGEESGGCFMVGYKGRLFTIEEDYQVAEPVDNYQAVGCGQDIALGVLYATDGVDPMERITLALKASERHSAGVRGPFTIMSV